MLASSPGRNYVIVSPVKDEEAYIETTICSVLDQTLPPSKWIIVDDGSRDRSPEIALKYSQRFPWIQVIKLARDAERRLGTAEIRAFMHGFNQLGNSDFDYIVKLDCDLDLPPDYFRMLIEKFEQDDRLGIASGIYLEAHYHRWLPIKMPAYHAAGATKVVRKKCYAEIGGFIAFQGWDTVDEIRAQVKGWTTRHFEAIKFHHLKPEGSGVGPLRTGIFHGEIYYRTGGGSLFFALKLLHQAMAGKPFLLGALAMLWGYLRLLGRRQARLVTPEEARLYRQILNRRILAKFGQLFNKLKPKREAWSAN
jgi:glycosyltransferase involved in cell wall biosynthesis